MTQQTIHHPFTNVLSFGAARAIILTLGLLALAGIIYLGQSSQATLIGQHVQSLQEQKERLVRENAQLEYDIAVLSTPDKIAERARNQGLHPPLLAQTIFVTVKNYPTNLKPPVAVIDNPRPASTADSIIVTVWNELLTRIGWTSSARTAEAMSNP